VRHDLTDYLGTALFQHFAVAINDPVPLPESVSHIVDRDFAS
jgi:hypothetical protein